MRGGNSKACHPTPVDRPVHRFGELLDRPSSPSHRRRLGNVMAATMEGASIGMSGPAGPAEWWSESGADDAALLAVLVRDAPPVMTDHRWHRWSGPSAERISEVDWPWPGRTKPGARGCGCRVSSGARTPLCSASWARWPDRGSPAVQAARVRPHQPEDRVLLRSPTRKGGRTGPGHETRTSPLSSDRTSSESPQRSTKSEPSGVRRAERHFAQNRSHRTRSGSVYLPRCRVDRRSPTPLAISWPSATARHCGGAVVRLIQRHGSRTARR